MTRSSYFDRPHWQQWLVVIAVLALMVGYVLYGP